MSKKPSVFSQLNKKRIRMLTAQKQMTAAGLAAMAHVVDPNKEQVESFAIPSNILQSLRANKQTWANLQQFSAVYQRSSIAYIECLKCHGQEPSQKTLRHFIDMTSRNKCFVYVKERL